MGAHPPPIHAELPADGHGDLFALAPGGLGIGQQLCPLGDRFVIGLKLDQAPGGLHQYGSQARISVLGVFAADAGAISAALSAAYGGAPTLVQGLAAGVPECR